MKPTHLALPLLFALTATAFADMPLPSSLGTLTNPADQTITFGSATTTSSLTLENNASLTNLGTWNAYAGTIAPDYVYSGPTFAAAILNTGTVNINAGTGSFSILDFPANTPPFTYPVALPVTFTNTGNINVLSGTFNLAASDTGTSSGTIALSTGTTLSLAGNLTFDANSSITGAGNVLISTNNPNYGYVPTTINTPPAIIFNGDYSTTGNTTIVGTNVTFNTNATLNNLDVSPGTDVSQGSIYPTLAGSGTLTLTGSGLFMGSGVGLGGPSITAGYISIRSILVTGTLNLDALEINGTNITVAPGASLFLISGLELPCTNGATIVNNGVIRSRAWLGSGGGTINPPLTVTNNNTLYVQNNFQMGQKTIFNNNGHVVVIQAGTFEVSGGTDTPNASIDNENGWIYLTSRPFLQGSINNAFAMVVYSSSARLGSALNFVNTGTLEVPGSSSLLLEAPQQSATNGTFIVEGPAPLTRAGILEFATDYDFSSPSGPSFSHDYYNHVDGILIVDPGVTLTLPSDTVFNGTIDVYGNLIIAPPLNAADAGLAPNFTVIYETPEPATLTLLALATPLLFRRRVRRNIP